MASLNAQLQQAICPFKIELSRKPLSKLDRKRSERMR